MMTKDEMMNELGLAGEKIIINMLSESGHKVKTSINKYDSEKEDSPMVKFTKMVATEFEKILKEKIKGNKSE